MIDFFLIAEINIFTKLILIKNEITLHKLFIKNTLFEFKQTFKNKCVFLNSTKFTFLDKK